MISKLVVNEEITQKIKKSILIVDDDKGTLKTMTLIFNKLGFETDTASTGSEAMKKVQRKFYNLLFLDIKLPDIEGIELISPLKEIQPNIELVMITAFATLEIAVRALNEGASAFIIKPYNFDEVLIIVNKVLERQHLIIEKQKTEELLRKSEKRYRKAYDRVNFYKDILTHDINNVLQIFLSSIELLSLYQKDAKKSENVEEITNTFKNQIYRAVDLVSNVRKLSDLEEKPLLVRKINAYNILNDAIKYLHQCFKDRNIKIELKSTSKTYFVKANELLFDVFENLIINAVKFNTNPVVEIKIRISKRSENNKNYFIFEFIDNGIGIRDNMKDKIFLGGYRQEKKIKGMGLGLSIVKTVIKNYNGQIRVEDKVKGDPSKGSNFIISIPEAV